MSNFTPQQIMNRGFIPVDEKQVLVQTTATQITTTAPIVNAMLLKAPNDISGGALCYIGSSTVTNTTGLPLFDYNGLGQIANTQPPILIITDDPTAWYLAANIANVKMNILFLKYNNE